MFRRVPGTVQAENYGHDREGRWYHVNDTNSRADAYRTREPVPVEREDDPENEFLSEQCIRLHEGEWTAYPVASREHGRYQGRVKLSAEILPASFRLENQDNSRTIVVARKGWHEFVLPDISFTEGWNDVKVTVTAGTVRFDWFRFA